MQESTLASIAFNIQNFKKDIQIKLFLLMNNSMHDEFFPRFFIFFETFEKNKKNRTTLWFICTRCIGDGSTYAFKNCTNSIFLNMLLKSMPLLLTLSAGMTSVLVFTVCSSESALTRIIYFHRALFPISNA